MAGGDVDRNQPHHMLKKHRQVFLASVESPLPLRNLILFQLLDASFLRQHTKNWVLNLAQTANARQGVSQDLETGCPKLAIVKRLGVQFFKLEQNILRFQQSHV